MVTCQAWVVMDEWLCACTGRLEITPRRPVVGVSM